MSISKQSKNYLINLNCMTTDQLPKESFFFHGINERILNLSSKLQSRHEIDTVRLQFERLTSPDGMGNLIKCLFISKFKINSDILKTHV